MESRVHERFQAIVLAASLILGSASRQQPAALPHGRRLQYGKYITKKEGTPPCNLFVTVLNKMGVEADVFGQSTGTLTLN